MNLPDLVKIKQQCRHLIDEGLSSYTLELIEKDGTATDYELTDFYPYIFDDIEGLNILEDGSICYEAIDNIEAFAKAIQEIYNNETM